MNFASRANLDIIEDLYKQFKTNPESVSADWQHFFQGLEFGQEGSMGLSEKELERDFNTIDRLRAHPEIAKFARWIGGKPPGFRRSHPRAAR